VRGRSDCGDLDSAIALSPPFFIAQQIRSANPEWQRANRKEEDHKESAPLSQLAGPSN